MLLGKESPVEMSSKAGKPWLPGGSVSKGLLPEVAYVTSLTSESACDAFTGEDSNSSAAGSFTSFNLIPSEQRDQVLPHPSPKPQMYLGEVVGMLLQLPLPELRQLVGSSSLLRQRLAEALKLLGRLDQKGAKKGFRMCTTRAP